MALIKEIKNKADMKKFIALPYGLYKNKTNWIPPLLISQKSLFDFEKNPFWKNADHAFFLPIKMEKLSAGLQQ